MAFIRNTPWVSKEDHSKVIRLANNFLRNYHGKDILEGINGFVELLNHHGLSKISDAVNKWKYGMINSNIKPFTAPIYSHLSDRKLFSREC